MIRVCFVCLGNICRSPQAEGIFKHLVQRDGLTEYLDADSAGTGAWHTGEPPDRRTQAASLRRGVRLQGRARQVNPSDFQQFDLLLAIDQGIAEQLQRMVPSPELRSKVQLLRAFDHTADDAAVPDPYYGGETGFERVFDICWRACDGLIDHLCREHGLQRRPRP